MAVSGLRSKDFLVGVRIGTYKISYGNLIIILGDESCLKFFNC